VDRQDLVAAVARERAAGRRVVFTNGCFDILHLGHADYLARAKAMGDVLVVGVNTDRSVRRLKGDARPIVPEDDRAALIAALGSVDLVCLFDEDTPLEIVSAVQPDVIVKGSGYTEDTIVGADVVKARGGVVAALGELPGRSTRSIIERVLALGRRCLG
jgi:D-beta-D-heptose 7-phosphate kinase/D-beta-D-heptose 1-phosphate adenosyltransferase